MATKRGTKPRPEFSGTLLHTSRKGYRIWEGAVTVKPVPKPKPSKPVVVDETE